jgi:hypothetical protein
VPHAPASHARAASSGEPLGKAVRSSLPVIKPVIVTITDLPETSIALAIASSCTSPVDSVFSADSTPAVVEQRMVEDNEPMRMSEKYRYRTSDGSSSGPPGSKRASSSNSPSSVSSAQNVSPLALSPRASEQGTLVRSLSGTEKSPSRKQHFTFENIVGPGKEPKICSNYLHGFLCSCSRRYVGRRFSTGQALFENAHTAPVLADARR